MNAKRIHPKWYLCAALILAGIVALFLLRGYQTSGLAFLGLAGLIPVYHALKILKSIRPRLGRLIIMVFSGFLCLFFIAVAVTAGIVIGTGRGTASPDSDYLVVLGAHVNGTTPSRSLRERLEAASGYLAAHPNAIAIVSGGQGTGEDISEARCMYNYLTASGIAAERVWMEDRATNTMENLRFSQDVIESRTGVRPTKIAIVSSEYHLYRANLFAKRLQIDADLIPAKTGLVSLRWNYILREVFAIWYYCLFPSV